MRKTLVIAAREYAAAVKSKAFLVSLVVMPLLMFGGIFVQRMAAKISDVKDKRIAIVDRSPGEVLVAPLQKAADLRNQNEIFNKQTGKQTQAKILVEHVAPAPLSDKDAVNAQRLELSDRARHGEIFAFIEIGPDVLRPRPNATTKMVQSKGDVSKMSAIEKAEMINDFVGDNNGVRYCTNRPTNADVREFLQNALNNEVFRRRMEIQGLPYMQVMPLITPPKLLTYGLTARGGDGKIVNATRENEVAMFLVPLALLALMFMIVMVGASPLTVNLVEEKQLRIAEVLLGSVRPFTLMMGKLLGGVGVALTLAAVYFVGLYYVARQYNVASVVSVPVMCWFLFFTILATLMYGAMFVAAGSAVTNVKEAQSMLMPVVVLVVMPMFILESLIREPSGLLATIGSFFPTSAPMVTIARIAIPPGIPLWQAALSALIALTTTAVIVWAAGRIFRVGILMQGQGARPLEMLKWVVRG